MFCNKCGTKIEGTASFCPKCGTPVAKNAASEEVNISEAAVSEQAVTEVQAEVYAQPVAEMQQQVYAQPAEQQVLAQPVAYAQPVVQPVVREKKKINPLSIVALFFAGAAFFFTFILVTTAMVNKLGIDAANFLGTLPAFAALGIGVYQFFNEKSGKGDKIISVIAASIALVMLLYSFIGYMVFLN